MLNDWVTPWLIACVISAVFGWKMYSRGFNAGGKESSRIICLALDDAGVMTPQTLSKYVEQYYLKIIKQEEN